MSIPPRLSGTRHSGSWLARLGLLLTGALAVALTAGIVVLGFFIGLVVIGLISLAALVFWVRRKIRGAPPAGVRASSRGPVVIDGEFVVLSSTRTPRRD